MLSNQNQRLGVNVSVSTLIAQTGTVVLSNSNSVTFGMQPGSSSQVVTASVNTTGYIQAFSGGTTVLPFGQAVISDANGLQFGINGQTITAQIKPISNWNNGYRAGIGASIPTASATPNLSLQRVWFDQPIAATRLNLIVSLSVLASNSGSYTFSVGIFTMNGSTASRASSASMAVTFSSGAATNDPTVYGGQSGGRQQSITLGTWNITPGHYLVGFVGSATGLSTFNWINGQLSSLTIGVPGGGNLSAYFGDGLFSAATPSVPASIHLSDIIQTHAGTGSNDAVCQPYFHLAGTF